MDSESLTVDQAQDGVWHAEISAQQNDYVDIVNALHVLADCETPAAIDRPLCKDVIVALLCTRFVQGWKPAGRKQPPEEARPAVIPAVFEKRRQALTKDLGQAILARKAITKAQQLSAIALDSCFKPPARAASERPTI